MGGGENQKRQCYKSMHVTLLIKKRNLKTMHVPILISAGEQLITMLRRTYNSLIFELCIYITLVIICVYEYKYVITFHVLINNLKLVVQHISSQSNIISIVELVISMIICGQPTAAIEVWPSHPWTHPS